MSEQNDDSHLEGLRAALRIVEHKKAKLDMTRDTVIELIEELSRAVDNAKARPLSGPKSH